MASQTAPTNRISASERRWLLGFSLLVMAATSLPYLVGFAHQGDSWRFTGFLIGVEDGNSYIAKMLSGAAGAWLFRTPYTTLPQAGAVLFLPYLLLGKLAGGSGMHEQLVALYHLFRIGAGVLAILATYEFLAFFVTEARWRRFGVTLATLGGGLGWVLILTGQENLLGSFPLEFFSPESFGFLGLLGFPHLALSRALILWTLVGYLKAVEGLGQHALSSGELIRTGGKIGVPWLLAGLAQPLAVVVIGAVVVSHLSFWGLSLLLPGLPGSIQSAARQSWGRAFRLVAAAGILPAGFLLYNLLAVLTDPFLAAWSAQNVIRSPHPAHYLFAYGLLIPFAWAGGRRLLAQRPLTGWLPVSWALFLPALAYAPVDLQRRLPEGVFVALVCLSLAGIEAWTVEKKVGKPFRVYQLVTTFLFPSTLLLLAGSLEAALQPGRPAFLPTDEAQAFQFIRDIGETGDVVLAAYDTSNPLPAWTPAHVLIGHGPESAGLAELQPQVERFFSMETADAERLDMTRRFQIRYLVWGPAERRLGSWDPRAWAYLKLQEQAGEYYVFEVID